VRQRNAARGAQQTRTKTPHRDVEKKKKSKWRSLLKSSLERAAILSSL